MGDIHYRTATLEIETRGKDDGRVTATLSTDNPVQMPYGTEILSHEAGAVNLTRAKNGLPLLWQHSPNEIIGRVENIRLEGRRLRGDLRAGNSQKAKELWEDLRAGIIKDVSIGYSVDERVIRDGEVFIVPKWTIYETSLVSIGADASAGIGRNLHSKNLGGKIMIENHEHEGQPEDGWKKDKYQERMRIQEILAIRKQFQNVVSDEDAQRAIANGVSIEDFKRFTLERLSSKTTPMIDTSGGDPFIGLSSREASNFSFTRALRAMITNDWREAGFEREASMTVEKRLGKKAQGVFVPGEVLQSRSLSKGTGASGGFTVATDLLSDSFIELMRNKTQVIKLGATIIGGLVGDVAIPRQTGAASAFWVADGSDITLSQQTFGQVALSPKTVAARTQFTRKLLLQATPDIEGIVRNDLSAVLAVELDRAAVNGTGVSNQPRGILNTAGIGIVSIGANGGALTWEHVVSLIGTVEQSNAIGSGFLTNSRVKAALSRTFTNATSGEVPIWQNTEGGEGRLAGYKALTSANVPSNLTRGTGTNLSAIIFGNWTDLLIGQWGVLDLLLDPYTLAASGGMQVRAMLDVDIAVRHPQSFAAVIDAVAG